MTSPGRWASSIWLFSRGPPRHDHLPGASASPLLHCMHACITALYTRIYTHITAVYAWMQHILQLCMHAYTHIPALGARIYTHITAVYAWTHTHITALYACTYAYHCFMDVCVYTLFTMCMCTHCLPCVCVHIVYHVRELAHYCFMWKFFIMFVWHTHTDTPRLDTVAPCART
jgi:hypothetical protein